MPDLLTVSNLKVSYGGNFAVRDVSLKVREGQVVAVIGPNGAGKTTLLRGVNGLARSRGVVTFDGADISTWRPWRIFHAGIAHVPQGRRLYPNMTVDDNLALGARGGKNDEIRESVFELFPVLKERRQGRAGFLSGGEQQMLAIGRALMSRPKLILLDEPSFGLAPMMVSAVFATLSRIAESGISMLIVEQNVKQALAIADYMYILKAGLVTYEATAQTAQKEADFVDSYLS